jgi:hypothetical protein
LNIICNQSFFYFEMMSALFRSEFAQGWKDIGAKTYLFTTCANCYLRFWGKVIFKTRNIQSTTWSWLNLFVRLYAIIQQLTWSLIYYEKYSTSQLDLWPVTSHWQTLSHNVVHLTLIEIRTSMVIGTDCVGSCKSNYHTITITTAPKLCLLFRSYRLNQLINLSTARPPLFISSSDILFWYLLIIICKENEWIFSKFKISKFEVTIRLIKCYFMNHIWLQHVCIKYQQ